MTQAYFVSDLHLKDPAEEKTQLFVRFLRGLIQPESLEKRATHLFLVGDIFDLWIGSHAYFQDRFASVVQAIQDLVKSGVEVHFFEGNHDLYLEPFWQRQLGVHVHANAAFFELAGQTIRVEHGDLINPDDTGYLFLRRFLRSTPMRWTALNLPSRLIALIGEKASQASRHHTSTAKELPQQKIRELIHAHVHRVHNERKFDLIVTGHVHVEDDTVLNIAGKGVRSVNLGSWYESPRAFLLNESSGQMISLD